MYHFPNINNNTHSIITSKNEKLGCTKDLNELIKIAEDIQVPLSQYLHIIEKN